MSSSVRSSLIAFLIAFMLLCGCAKDIADENFKLEQIPKESVIVEPVNEKESLDIVQNYPDVNERKVPRYNSQANAELLEAINALDPNRIKAALDSGANPNLKFSPGDGRPVVSYVVMRFMEREEDCLLALNHLFNYGAILQPYDDDYGEALFWSIANAFPSVTEFLINKGASPTRRFEGFVPIEWAYHYGHHEIAKVLIKYGAKPLSNKQAALLHFIHLAGDFSYEGNKVAKMKELLSKGIDINGKNSRGESALIESVGDMGNWLDPRGTYNTVNFLIENGANVNIRGKCNHIEESPLHAIVDSCSFWFAQDPNDPKVQQFKPNVQVVQFFIKISIQKLLKAGTHVSARDEFERTPLHIAAENNNIVVANMLIEAGAKLMDKDKNGKTPLDYAESGEMIKLLKSHGATEQ